MLVQELGKNTFLFTRGAQVPDDEHTDYWKEEQQVSRTPFASVEDKIPVTNSFENKWEFIANDHFNANKERQLRPLSKFIQGKEINLEICVQ